MVVHASSYFVTTTGQGPISHNKSIQSQSLISRRTRKALRQSQWNQELAKQSLQEIKHTTLVQNPIRAVRVSLTGVVRAGSDERGRDVRLHPQLPLRLLLRGRQRGHGVHQAPQRNHR